MNDHICHHEEKLGAMQKTVDHLEKEIDGNGKVGLSVTVPAMSIKIDTLISSVGDLRTAVSGFARFEAGYQAEQNHKKWNFTKTMQTLGLVIAFSSLLIAFVVMQRKTTEGVREMIDQYGYDMRTRGDTLNIE